MTILSNCLWREETISGIFELSKHLIMFYQKTYSNTQNLTHMLGSKKWLSRMNQIIENRLGDTTFGNQALADEMDISERHLFRKVNQLTELSPQKYLRKYRLTKAYDYLKTGKFQSVKETAYAIGYVNVSYFIRQFEKQHGKRPLQVLKESGWR